MTLRPLLPLLFAILMPALAQASADTDDADKRLRLAVNEVLTAADQSDSPATLAAKVRPILERYVNFDVMTRRAVGVGWQQFAPEQREEAIRLFTTLIIRTYSRKFVPGERADVTYKQATEPAPGRVEIETISSYQGSRYQVIYRLEKAGGWQITDVVIEGVSMVANYRAQFDAQFKSGGAAAVLRALNQSVASKS